MLVAGTVARDTIVRVDSLPGRDEAERAEAIVDGPGGCGANVAHALARLGKQPSLLSAVGGDFAGSAEEARLDDVGVELDGLIRVADASTARAVLTSDSQGHQAITYQEGPTPAMSELEPEEAPIGHFAPGELTAYPPLMAACEQVTYSPGQETFYRPIEEVLAPLEHADVLLVNEHEAKVITDAAGGLDALLAEVEAVVVSDAEGQDVHTPDERLRVPGVEAEPVDTTGAGDAHAAGIVYGLSEGWPLETGCRLGSVLAAFAIEALGAQTNLPTLDEALDRYEAAYGERPG